jgi:hypothetical protein
MYEYEGKVTNCRPADLGHFVGYGVAEAYFPEVPERPVEERYSERVHRLQEERGT